MYLLDTMYGFYLLQQKPSFIEHIKKFPSSTYVAISVITLGEIKYGVEISECRESNLELFKSFSSLVDIYNLDNGIAEVYGEIKSKIKNRFFPGKRKEIKYSELGISDNDLWIASIGVSHNLTVVTKNGDYDRIKEAESRLKIEKWNV